MRPFSVTVEILPPRPVSVGTDWEPYLRRYGVRILEGSGEVICPGPQEHLNTEGAAYAKAYNLVLLQVVAIPAQ
jgi:hypothetical protein